MLNGKLFAGLALGVLISGLCAWWLLATTSSHVPQKWINLSLDGSGIAYAEAVFDADISLPNQSNPTGQAKFLDRPDGIKLGYIVKDTVQSLDTSKIPAKYLRPKKFAHYEVDPVSQVTYDAHLEFILKAPMVFCAPTDQK